MIELVERPVSILLVDDDPERVILAKRLQRESPRYRVLHALSLYSAMEALKGAHFDVVLCDYFLEGGKTAKDLVDSVVASGHSTKVVVFSAVEEGEFKKEVLEAGAFWYLTKPVVFSELVHTVRTIDSFRRERELGETSTKLARISSRFHSTLQLEEVVQRAVEAALELGFHRARIYLFNEEHGSLVRYAAAGMSRGSFSEFEIQLSGSGLIDRIFDLREPAAWSFQSSREFATPADLAWIHEVDLEDVPWLDCPLLVGDKRIGTLAVDCKGSIDPALTPQQKETVGVLSGLVAQAVNNCRLYQAEARAQASLRQILIEAPDAVITTTLDGTIDFVSPSTESILGTPAAQLVRKKAAEVYIDPSGGKDSGLAIAEAVMQDLKAGRPVSNRRIHVVGPDGRPRPLSLSASLLHDRHGGPVGTLGFLKSLGFLEQQFEEYRNLLEGFGYGTVILSRVGSISFLNRKAERLLGGVTTDLVGKSLAALLRPKDGENLEQQMREIRSSREAVPLRVEASTASGEVVPLELSISPIRLGSSLKGFAVGLYDRREQERLIWAGRLAALGEMVGALAHEINNPLNNILTATKTLGQALVNESDSRDSIECLRTLNHGARRIAELVRRLGRLSRNEPSSHEQVDLKRLLHDFLDFFSRRLMAARIDVQVKISEGNLLIQGDPVQIEQILTSLVANSEEAMKAYTPKRLSIDIRKSSRSWVQLAIEDSGPGVPRGYRDEIFDLFFTTKSKQGTGFGLAISRAIAREHGGDLRLEETISGRGARFVLELPLLGSEEAKDLKEDEQNGS